MRLVVTAEAMGSSKGRSGACVLPGSPDGLITVSCRRGPVGGRFRIIAYYLRPELPDSAVRGIDLKPDRAFGKPRGSLTHLASLADGVGPIDRGAFEGPTGRRG